MMKKKFMNAVASGREDILQKFLDLLKKARSKYCVIGGLAVNAYVEPVVSLDLDIVVSAKDLENVCKKAKDKGFKVERFPHSFNLTSGKSDLRIQLQTDAKYQEFIPRSKQKRVLGYPMKVAILEDVLKGKIWAYSDETRRKSKRQKDLADIVRIIESFPALKAELPARLQKEFN